MDDGGGCHEGEEGRRVRVDQANGRGWMSRAMHEINGGWFRRGWSVMSKGYRSKQLGASTPGELWSGDRMEGFSHQAIRR
jgi:hypothetical protein